MDLKSIGGKTPCRFKSGPGHFVLVAELEYAQRLGRCSLSGLRVRIPPRTFCGHGLVAECDLAKVETGVRFSLPA